MIPAPGQLTAVFRVGELVRNSVTNASRETVTNGRDNGGTIGSGSNSCKVIRDGTGTPRNE